MNITIEGSDLLDIEEKIIAAAASIVERRQVLSEGCTCHAGAPAARQYTDAGGVTVSIPLRCTAQYALCESRKLRMAPAVFGFAPGPAGSTTARSAWE